MPLPPDPAEPTPWVTTLCWGWRETLSPAELAAALTRVGVNVYPIDDGTDNNNVVLALGDLTPGEARAVWYCGEYPRPVEGERCGETQVAS